MRNKSNNQLLSILYLFLNITNRTDSSANKEKETKQKKANANKSIATKKISKEFER